MMAHTERWRIALGGAAVTALLLLSLVLPRWGGIRDRAVVVACPKLDDFEAHQSKLNDILRQSDIKSLTAVHMEVPCCSGLVHMAHQAVKDSGKNIPVKEVTVGMNGEIKGRLAVG